MKIFFNFFVLCLLSIAAKAQMNTDTIASAPIKVSGYDQRVNQSHDHLHPKFPNLANPGTPGYEVDGTVYHSEAIINRHALTINDLIK